MKQTFAPNKPNDQRTEDIEENYPFVCLTEDGESFEIGIQELMKRVMCLIKQSCKEIINARVFSRLKCLEGENSDPLQESTSTVITYAKGNPFSTYRHTYTRHTLMVTCLALYEPSYLLSGSGDHKVHLWDRNIMEVVHTFPGPGGVHSLQVYENYLFIAYTNKFIHIWNLIDRSLVLKYATRNIEAIIVIPTENPAICHLYTGHSKSFRRSDVCLTDSPATIKETHSLVGRDDTVYCAVLFQTHILFTASVGNTIRAWDLRYFGTDLTIVYLSGHTGRVNCLLVRGTQLFSGSDDHSIRIWDIIALTPVSILHGHDGPVTSLTTAGTLLYSASKDKTIGIWNLLTNERTHTLQGHTAGVECLIIDQLRLYSGAGDYTIKVWDDTDDIPVTSSQNENIFTFQPNLPTLEFPSSEVLDCRDLNDDEGDECVDLLSEEANKLSNNFEMA